MLDREKVIKGLENCITGFDCPEECPYLMDCNDLAKPMFVDLAKDALSLLKDRTRDYEAWAKGIGVDTCVNCHHASFNRNDGKSTCPIEHNFALVKDGYCHLFIRVEGR